MADKICPECKTLNQAGAMYCVECGAKLIAPPAAIPAPAPVVSLTPAPAVSSGPARVIVVDFDMTFGSMVLFMVKWTLAAIPAMIILFFLFAVVSAIFGGMFAALLGGLLNF
jgi:hypothetical protein